MENKEQIFWRQLSRQSQGSKGVTKMEIQLSDWNRLAADKVALGEKNPSKVLMGKHFCSKEQALQEDLPALSHWILTPHCIDGTEHQEHLPCTNYTGSDGAWADFISAQQHFLPETKLQGLGGAPAALTAE
ncbi:Prame Family Member 19 [Manis pentadactyla]|nr:Prame Family Member 19 [Manis pentadactyla]